MQNTFLRKKRSPLEEDVKLTVDTVRKPHTDIVLLQWWVKLL